MVQAAQVSLTRGMEAAVGLTVVMVFKVLLGAEVALVEHTAAAAVLHLASTMVLLEVLVRLELFGWELLVVSHLPILAIYKETKGR